MNDRNTQLVQWYANQLAQMTHRAAEAETEAQQLRSEVSQLEQQLEELRGKPDA